MFAPGAIAVLYKHTRGVPRLINVIAHKALLAAYGEGVPQVSRQHVVRAAQDTPAAAAVHQARSFRPGLALTAAAVFGVAVWLYVA